MKGARDLNIIWPFIFCFNVTSMLYSKYYTYQNSLKRVFLQLQLNIINIHHKSVSSVQTLKTVLSKILVHLTTASSS